MALSGVEAAQRRIEEIETRINSLFGTKEEKLLYGNFPADEASDNSYVSFGEILNNKLSVEDKYLKTPKLPNTTTLPSVSELPGVPKGEVLRLIDKYSKKYNLDKNLVKAVVQTESAFKSNAVSHAGAIGLMQLMPSTAKGLGVENPFNPEENIEGGTKYLKNLINKYDSVKIGIAAYNAGPGAVDKHGGIPPYRETQNYVKKIVDLADVE